MSNKPKLIDYSTPDLPEIEKVVMVVKAGGRYGDAFAGQRVKIDRAELSRGPTAETLQAVIEYEAERASEETRKGAPAPRRPAPVGDAIGAALDRMWKAAREKAARKQAPILVPDEQAAVQAS